MNSRVLLVGEFNPHRDDPAYALHTSTPAGSRLCGIFGMEEREYLARFDRANLCRFRWSRVRARIEAQRLLHCESDWERVVLLGCKVSVAFRVEYEPLTRSGVFLVLPHPSGLNRLWNDSTLVERTREFLRREGVL